MSNSPKYIKISHSTIHIKNNRNKYVLSRLKTDKKYKYSLKNELILRNTNNKIKEDLKNNSLLKAISYYKEEYNKINKENKTLQSSYNISNIIYKQNTIQTFHDLIKLYKSKRYNITDEYMNKNTFKKCPLLFSTKERINSFFEFKTEKENNKYIRFIDKENNIITKRKNLYQNKIGKINIRKKIFEKIKNEDKNNKSPFKTIDISKPINRINSAEKKFISLYKLNNMKKMIKKFKNELKVSKSINNIINSNNEENKLYLIKNSIPINMNNNNYKKEIENLLKLKDKSSLLEQLQNINIINFQRNELEKIIEYFAKTFLKFNENQIKKMLIPKNTNIDKELLIILNTFMKRNNMMKQKNKFRYLNNFDFFNSVIEVDNQTFNLQKKLIENQTGD